MIGMMFHMQTIFIALESARLMAKYEQDEARAFEQAISTLTPYEQDKARTERRESLERARIERDTERRHKELCKAIRDSGFWP